LKIANKSMAAISISEDGSNWEPLAGQCGLKTTAKKVILKIHHTPCRIEIEDEPATESLQSKSSPLLAAANGIIPPDSPEDGELTDEIPTERT